MPAVVSWAIPEEATSSVTSASGNTRRALFVMRASLHVLFHTPNSASYSKQSETSGHQTRKYKKWNSCARQPYAGLRKAIQSAPSSQLICGQNVAGWGESDCEVSKKTPCLSPEGEAGPEE